MYLLHSLDSNLFGTNIIIKTYVLAQEENYRVTYIPLKKNGNIIKGQFWDILINLELLTNFNICEVLTLYLGLCS